MKENELPVLEISKLIGIQIMMNLKNYQSR